MNPATKVVVGTLVDGLGPVTLLDPAAVHHRDPVRHRQRLLLVMGDVDKGDPDLALDPLQLELESLAQFQVEGAERLVEQQHLRQVDQRPGERHALLHAAGELVRPPVDFTREPDPLELGLDPALDLVLGHPLALEPEGDVLTDAQVGEERVALEHRVGRPLVRREAGDVCALDLDRATRRLLEAADHPQGRRLAAARRAEQGEELPVGDLEVHRLDGDEIVERLRHSLQAHAGFAQTRTLLIRQSYGCADAAQAKSPTVPAQGAESPKRPIVLVRSV